VQLALERMGTWPIVSLLREIEGDDEDVPGNKAGVDRLGAMESPFQHSCGHKK
jgi:hypothetical protein